MDGKALCDYMYLDIDEDGVPDYLETGCDVDDPDGDLLAYSAIDADAVGARPAGAGADHAPSRA